MSTDLAALVKESVVRELESLRDAVRDLAGPLDERQFWTKPLEPGNSFGHLVLHLTGNLSWFVGGQLGGTGYVREREREFTETNPPAKAEALAGLDEAVATFRRVVEGLTAERLAAPHPTRALRNRGQRPGASDLALRVTPRAAFLHRPPGRRRGEALRPHGAAQPVKSGSFHTANFTRSSHSSSFRLREVSPRWLAVGFGADFAGTCRRHHVRESRPS